MEKVKFNIISPDGFPSWPEPFICDKDKFEEESKAKLQEFLSRFERQGYYSSNNGRIPLDELPNHCQIKLLDNLLKKTVVITQSTVYRAQVYLTAEEIKMLEQGEYERINYDHVDKWSETETDIAVEDLSDYDKQYPLDKDLDDIIMFEE